MEIGEDHDIPYTGINESAEIEEEDLQAPYYDHNDFESEALDSYTYDQVLELLGGFGRFQWFSTIILILSFMTGGQIYYGLTFLTILPQYECKQVTANGTEWISCTANHICDLVLNPSDWRPNYEDESSIYNWADPSKLDLTCVSRNKVGAIGSAFFVGFAISSMFVPRLGDKYGRKKPYLASMITQLVFYILLFYSTNLNFTIFCFFMVGMCAGGRISIGTMYLSEFVPEKYHPILITSLLSGDASSLMFQAIYYKINNNWQPLHIFGIFVSFIILICTFLIPESPKYYYTQRMFDEARKSLKVISIANKSTLEPDLVDALIFDTEVKEDNQAYEDSTETEGSDVNGPLIRTTEQGDQEVIKLTGNITEVWTVWQLRRNSQCLLVLLSISSFGYYLINFDMKRINGSITTNTLVSQISEICAYVVSVLFYVYIGAKKGFTIGFGLMITGSLLLLLYPTDIASIPLYVGVAKFGVAFSFNIVYLVAVGLIPTMFASTVFGFCNVAARFITISAPIIAEQEPPLPMLLSVLSGSIAIFAAQFIITKLPKFE